MCFVKLASMYTTLVMLTCNGIVTRSYFLEAGKTFTSPQICSNYLHAIEKCY